MKKYRTTFKFSYTNKLGKHIETGQRFFEGSFNKQYEAEDAHWSMFDLDEPTAENVTMECKEV